LDVQLGRAGEIAAWPAEAGGETELHRIAARGEDNRNGRGRRFCSHCRRRAGGGNHADLTTNEFVSQCRQAIVLARCPVVVYCYVVTLYVTLLTQAPPERRDAIWVRGSAVEKPDHGHRLLLRPRRDRPHCRAAEQCDELAATAHSITSSASSCIELGTARLSVFAVLKLITNSNLVDRCTGRSAGFSPLTIRPVYTPAWRYESAKSLP